MIDLFEDQLIPENIFVNVPLTVVHPLIFSGKGLPEKVFSLTLHPENGFTASDIPGIVNFIVGVVWEEGIIGIFSSGRQRPVAGGKHPDIGIADNVHKEGWHLIEMGDFEELLSETLHHFSPDGFGIMEQGGLS
ncbi:MAG: hypothetical protein D6732_03300 [Methanobacteriota archaeon]|nr:MAG: hypothetical protein D6732_03300 [Euryarchaeota archaeon]